MALDEKKVSEVIRRLKSAAGLPAKIYTLHGVRGNPSHEAIWKRKNPGLDPDDELERVSKALQEIYGVDEEEALSLYHKEETILRTAIEQTALEQAEDSLDTINAFINGNYNRYIKSADATKYLMEFGHSLAAYLVARTTLPYPKMPGATGGGTHTVTYREQDRYEQKTDRMRTERVRVTPIPAWKDDWNLRRNKKDGNIARQVCSTDSKEIKTAKQLMEAVTTRDPLILMTRLVRSNPEHIYYMLHRKDQEDLNKVLLAFYLEIHNKQLRAGKDAFLEAIAEKDWNKLAPILESAATGTLVAAGVQREGEIGLLVDQLIADVKPLSIEEKMWAVAIVATIASFVVSFGLSSIATATIIRSVLVGIELAEVGVIGYISAPEYSDLKSIDRLKMIEGADNLAAKPKDPTEQIAIAMACILVPFVTVSAAKAARKTPFVQKLAGYTDTVVEKALTALRKLKFSRAARQALVELEIDVDELVKELVKLETERGAEGVQVAKSIKDFVNTFHQNSNFKEVLEAQWLKSKKTRAGAEAVMRLASNTKLFPKKEAVQFEVVIAKREIVLPAKPGAKRKAKGFPARKIDIGYDDGTRRLLVEVKNFMINDNERGREWLYRQLWKKNKFTKAMILDLHHQELGTSRVLYSFDGSGIAGATLKDKKKLVVDFLTHGIQERAPHSSASPLIALGQEELKRLKTNRTLEQSMTARGVDLEVLRKQLVSLGQGETDVERVRDALNRLIDVN